MRRPTSKSRSNGQVVQNQKWGESHASGKFESGAKAAGKDPSQMPVLAELFVVAGDKKEAETSAELWRFNPQSIQDYYNVRDPQTIQQGAEAELPLEQVYGDRLVSADPDVHAKKVTELFSSGVTIVNVHSGQADQKRVMIFTANK